MKKPAKSTPRPFGLEFLQEVKPYVLAVTVVAACTTGCSPSKSGGNNGGSTAPPSTAPINSNNVTTMAYSMPSTQFPQGDSF